MSNVPPQKRTTSSGIEVDKGSVDYGVTATVTLSRKGMGMMQRKKGNEAAPPPPPPPASATNRMPFSVATDSDVACPKCNATYPITPEVFGFVAECESCGCEFLIKAPGSAPAPAAPRPAAPRPAAPSPAAPKPAARKPGPAAPKKPGAKAVPKPAAKKTPTSTGKAAAAPAAEAAPAAVAAPAKGKSNGMVIGLLVVVILVLGAVVAYLALR